MCFVLPTFADGFVMNSKLRGWLPTAKRFFELFGNSETEFVLSRSCDNLNSNWHAVFVNTERNMRARYAQIVKYTLVLYATQLKNKLVVLICVCRECWIEKHSVGTQMCLKISNYIKTFYYKYLTYFKFNF